MSELYYQVHHNRFRVLTLGATDHSPSFDSNTHRFVIQSETATEFVGWPDPTDKRNSCHWRPGFDRPMVASKFAWEVRSRP